MLDGGPAIWYLNRLRHDSAGVVERKERGFRCMLELLYVLVRRGLRASLKISGESDRHE